ncbi:MAG: helix-turn-helix domain-containing protein [Actinomycetota bacterium]|nr:helix-turn-helix domain-containing protein [Actinomycetota bacterium]
MSPDDDATTGASSREIHTSDPERIRALAHPLRLAIIDVVQDLGEATASECAERLGQTVANCSFHLRVLERAGFIERAEQRGREKPWRSASRRRYLEPDPESEASVLALAELVGATMAHIANRYTNYLREHAPHEDAAWSEAILLDQSTLWATAEEATAVRKALTALADPFRDRNHDPSLRPAGARRVRLATLIHPESPESTE